MCIRDRTRRSHRFNNPSPSQHVLLCVVYVETIQVWALLAKEAVLLGDCGAAAEYLAAAQKHNDAFHDRDNIIR